MTTIDNLRETIAKAAARSQGDETPIIHTAAQLRAAVAEHDALRDAVRGYLATLPESERDSTCGYGDCFDAAAFYGHEDGRLFCRAHSRHCRPITEPLPPRVVALRALAALVRS